MIFNQSTDLTLNDKQNFEFLKSVHKWLRYLRLCNLTNFFIFLSILGEVVGIVWPLNRIGKLK